MDWGELILVTLGVTAFFVFLWFVFDLLMGWSSWHSNQEQFRHKGLPGYRFWEYYHEIWHYGDALYMASHRYELEAKISRKVNEQQAAIRNGTK